MMMLPSNDLVVHIIYIGFVSTEGEMLVHIKHRGQFCDGSFCARYCHVMGDP